MYALQGRLRLTFACIVATASVGCNQPEPKNSLGNLPGQVPRVDDPRVNAATYFAHGHLLEMQGQLERAVVQYRKAVYLRPDFLSARNRLGITLNKLGRNAEATEQFQLAVADHADLAYLHNNLGFSLYLQEQYGDAEATLRRALELKSQFARAHMNLALVLARQRRFDEAFEELKLVGSPADAYFNMGIILTEAERYAEAAHYLEAALEARPDFDPARQQLREVSRLAAEAEARRAVQVALAEKAARTATAEPTDTIVAEKIGDGTETELQPVFGTTGTPDANTDATNAHPAVAGMGEPGNVGGEPAPGPMDAVRANVGLLVDVSVADPIPGSDYGEDETDGSETAEPSDVEVSELVVMANEVLEALTTHPDAFAFDGQAAADRDSQNATQWTGQEGLDADPNQAIDPELLFAMIDDAIRALQTKRPDVFESLWCRIGYYLFPETAPGAPFSEAESSTDQDGVLDARDRSSIGK